MDEWKMYESLKQVYQEVFSDPKEYEQAVKELANKIESIPTRGENKMSKMRDEIINVLKNEWISNFQAQIRFKSSSADRAIRDIRQNPPIGFEVISRKKKVEGYNPCLEFHLQKIGA